MKDFSIVIAHRGDAMGLWATLSSIEADLQRTGFDYDYRFCVNGNGPDRDYELEQALTGLREAGKVGSYVTFEEPLSPPSARNKAAEGADSRILCMFDNHVIVGRDYFRRVMIDFDQYGMDSLHSVTQFSPNGFSNYEYKLTLEKNFWTDEAKLLPYIEHKPYRIAMCGHGGYAIRADVWNELGGYWDGFVGYAGEEGYLDLKLALLDKTNYIDPRLYHIHYAGKRGYPRHFSDGYYRNLMMCANIIGGPEWLNKVYDHFSKCSRMKSNMTMFDLYVQAEVQSRAHAAEFAGQRLRSLDDQLKLFRQHEVSC